MPKNPKAVYRRLYNCSIQLLGTHAVPRGCGRPVQADLSSRRKYPELLAQPY